jgi:hypothetical protein
MIYKLCAKGYPRARACRERRERTEMIAMKRIAGVWLGFDPNAVVHEKEKPLRTMDELHAKGYPRAGARREECRRASRG